eukprot:13526084-Alexandrium_andersonii.AAC.1
MEKEAGAPRNNKRGSTFDVARCEEGERRILDGRWDGLAARATLLVRAARRPSSFPGQLRAML